MGYLCPTQQELLKIVYIDEGLSNIQDTSMAPFGKDSDSKNGVRCMQISPDGQVLATGDRSGNLRYEIISGILKHLSRVSSLLM